MSTENDLERIRRIAAAPDSATARKGYGLDIMRRDSFRCAYCGMDGRQSFDAWLALTIDHLLPKDDERREDAAFIVTACHACNSADNHYFRHAERRVLRFTQLSRSEFVAQRLPFVAAARAGWREFWKSNAYTD